MAEQTDSSIHSEGKPVLCPNCGNQMEAGFLGMEKLFFDIAWFKERTTLGFGGESLEMKDKMGLVCTEAHRCRGCRLVLFKH